MNGKVTVEFDQKQWDVIYEEGDESDRAEPIKTPLFKDMFTREETTKQEELPLFQMKRIMPQSMNTISGEI